LGKPLAKLRQEGSGIGAPFAVEKTEQCRFVLSARAEPYARRRAPEQRHKHPPLHAHLQIRTFLPIPHDCPEQWPHAKPSCAPIPSPRRRAPAASKALRQRAP